MNGERVWAMIFSMAAGLFASSVVFLLWTFMRQGRTMTRRRLMAGLSSSGTPPPEEGRWLSAASARRLTACLDAVLRLAGMKPEARLPGLQTTESRLTLAACSVLAALLVAWAAVQICSHMLVPAPMGWVVVVGVAWMALRVTAHAWRRWHARRWMAAVNRSLMDVLDLWVLCLGSGMSFHSALVRVGEDAELASPELREQLQLTAQEILAGSPREEALRHLARRCGDSADLNALVSNIIQSERLGGSLSQTLRVYAGALRFKWQQDVKELIHTLPVKLAFPLVFCVLPALFVVILGPSLVRMFGALSGH